MEFVQIAHAISYGDAASNQILAMHRVFTSLGFKSSVFAEKIDNNLPHDVRPFADFRPKDGQNIIFHFSTGTSFVDKVLKIPQRIILYYHNITPAEFFTGVAWGSYFSAVKGRKQLSQLREKTSFAWGASEYSRLELEQADYKQTSVLPIIVDFTDYEHAVTDENIRSRYEDGKLNFLFVGRGTPHKKLEDIVRVVFYYKNFIDPHVRLIFVGGQKKSYVEGLRQLIKKMGMEQDVVFAGKVSFAQMCTFYQIADLFLCMSEHEGFCVPLLEAMYYKLPVFAYESSAVPYTLGNSGVLFQNKDYPYIGELVHLVMSDQAIRQQIIDRQNERLMDFQIDKIKDLIRIDVQKICNIQ